MQQPTGSLREERGPTRSGEVSIELRGVGQVGADARYGTAGRLLSMWVKMNPSMFFVGALVGAPFIGLGLGPAILAIVIANVMGATITGVFATFGPRTGVPQLQQSRLSFGRFAWLPASLQWVTQIGFEALTLLFVAEALSVLFNVPFYVGAVVGLVCMGVISLLGYEVIHSFQKVMVVVFFILFAALTVAILGKGPHLVQTSHGGAAVGGFLLFVAIALGIALFCTSASDYSRYLPESTSSMKVVFAVAISLFVSMTWIELLGVLASSMLRGSSTMQGVYNVVGGGAVGAVAMIAMALGAISIMVLTDYSGALAAQAAGVHLLRPIITVISALIAFGVAVWLYSGNVSGRFEDVLLLISYWVTPWAAIVLVYWVREGGALSRERMTSIFSAPLGSLQSGVAAPVALVVGFLAALPFSDTGLDATISGAIPGLGWLFGGVSRGFLQGGDLDFYVGFVVAGGVYWLLRAIEGSRVPAEESSNVEVTTTR